MATANLADVRAGAIAKKEPPTFPVMLDQFKSEIARALPKHMNADRMARIALTAFRTTPALAACEPRSLFGAVVQSAQLGLEIGLMGEAFLVPFENSTKINGQWVKRKEASLIPGYQGLIKLARNSGLVKDMYAHEVRKNDKFEISLGLERSLKHEPLMEDGFPASDEARGVITGFYAVAVFKDGTTSFVAMSKQKVDRIRDKSKGYQAAVRAAEQYNKPNSSPWHTDYEAMGLKTAIRALCKWMPKSPELATALALDEANYRGQSQGNDAKEIIDGTWTVASRVDGEEDETPNDDGADVATNQADAAKVDETAKPKGEPVQSQDEPPPGAGRDLNAPRKGAKSSMGLE